MIRLLPALALLVTAGCAKSAMSTPAATSPSPSVTPAAAAMNAAGAYDFNTMAQGEQLTGTVYITGAPGSYSGRIESAGRPTFTATSVTATGNSIVMICPSDDGELRVQMTLNGDEVTGQWQMGGDTGTIQGRKRVS